MRTLTKKEGIQHIKAKLGESLKKKWESKVMHGHYIESMDRQIISEEDTFLWLLRGDLKGQTENEIVAAQDQALQAKKHVTKILQTEMDTNAKNKQFDDTLNHTSMPNNSKKTINRHDRMCAQLHFNTCKEIRVKLDNKHWYDNVPNAVETTHEVKVTILWNQQV